MSAGTENRRMMDDLLLTEFKSLRKEIREDVRGMRKEIREDVSGMHQDIKGIYLSCGNRTADCSKRFINSNTFWKIIVLGSVILLGSYSFTGTVLAMLFKHMADV